MLSRTAENLFWSARYIERADSLARLLEVGYRISLIPNTEKGYTNEWESILETSGIKNEYLKKYKTISKEKIIFYLLFDPENSSSVKNCIKTARENIRMVRTAVTLEVWNAVNSSYHELDKGTILNTQLINDGYDFLILGTYFERADFTARIINVKYFILLPSINYVGSDIDNFQWSLMLRSISSFRAFKWAYGGQEITYTKIIDFLILNMTCPRSLIFSIEKINHHLGRLSKFYKQTSTSNKKIGLMYKKIKNLNANKITEIGLHEFLKSFIEEINYVYKKFEQKYFFGVET